MESASHFKFFFLLYKFRWAVRSADENQCYLNSTPAGQQADQLIYVLVHTSYVTGWPIYKR